MASEEPLSLSEMLVGGNAVVRAGEGRTEARALGVSAKGSPVTLTGDGRRQEMYQLHPEMYAHVSLLINK